MKKKLLTLGLSSTLALSSIIPAFANSITPKEDKTYIETAIGFKFPEVSQDLKAKNLKATLTGNDINLEIDLNQFLNNDSYSTTIDNYVVSSKIIKENGKINVIKFKVDGLKSANGYKLQLEGKNYVTTVVDLSTVKYSKRINISTATNFVLGDIDKDGKVTASDRKILEDNLNTNNSQYDLNNDNKITGTDIAIVNANMINVSKPEIFETEMVTSQILENINKDTIESGIEIKEGDSLDNLFTKDTTVSVKAKNDEDIVSIPLEFAKAQQLSSVEVTIPNGAKDVQIALYDDENNIIPIDIPNEAISNYARTQEKVVVVNLGSRRPVKKITINVTPTQSGGYVEIEEVKLIGDVINEDIVKDTTVTNIKAIAGDKTVDLSWRAVPNVTGYKVYYGTSEDNLTNVITTDVTNVTISDLENLKTYYFAVSATSGSWEGQKSSIVSAIPQPEKAPNRPDFVTVTSGDGFATLSWKEAENAKVYNIYGKTEEEESFKKLASGITGTSYKVTGLKNNTVYTLYVTSENSIGESTPSEYVNATPKVDVIEPPTLPTKDRISKENIQKVEMAHPHNFDQSLYPQGFMPEWLIDEDYYTHWVARRYSEPNTFSFTFNTPKTMDYLIWVPRLDGDYKNSNKTYSINVWTQDQDLNSPGTQIVKDGIISQKFEDNKYYVLTFPKTENIKKISIHLGERTGGPRVNGSEVAFYEYNDIADRVSSLFANESRTQLAQNVDLSTITALKEEVSDIDSYVIDRDILLQELNIAEALFNNDTNNLGVIKSNLFSIDPEKDNNSYGIAINDWQPLGVVGNWKEKIVIYADIPEGETVSLVPTQVFEEATNLSASPITLKNGRNIITIPKIGQNDSNRGGSLYVTYKGSKANEIKLQVVGAHKIPYLELKDFHSISEEQAKERIRTFITELTSYEPNNLPGNKEWISLNMSEISLPNMLLSLPATKVLEGINQGVNDLESKVEKMYKNVQAWEELMGVIYKTYGIDNHKEGLETRQNIRYMKMFAGAFMYAGGNHIGIQYSSVAPLMNGTPTTADTKNQDENGLFGWGIAHEIGHIMDRLGKVEVTNNIYSLMAQTYDGEQNILPSRLEKSNVYEKAFKKVSVGGEGVPNDLFTHLTMYWQLHLAYDDGTEPFRFYNELHKLYRTDTSLASFTDMDKFAVASSKVAKKDLTEFFTRWGVVLSTSAKSEMAKQGEKEARAIYYLTDNSRRERLKNNQGNTNITVTSTVQVGKASNSKNEKAKEVSITISGNNENVQGYEILRKGAGDSDFKPIGFTTTNTYKDYIGSANNLTFTYALKPVDILGNVGAQQEIGQVRISYDNTVEKNLYNIDEQTGYVTFTEPTVVTGIKVTPKENTQDMPTGKYKVYADIVDNIAPTSANNNVEESLVLAKDGDFATNNFATTENTYISYFNKPGTSDDKIWAYDVNRLKLEGFNFDKYNVEFLSYPGDNVEFMDMGIGRLANDYHYDTEVIPKGSLVIIGKYRGNSVLSNIYIKGKYAKENSFSEEAKTEERLVEGYTLMFDTVDVDGTITSSTADGIFIFVPKIQEESYTNSPEKLSVLPTEIMAEMWQGTFNEDGSFEKTHLTSDTTWINVPSDESLPKIVLSGDAKSSPKITIK